MIFHLLYILPPVQKKGSHGKGRTVQAGHTHCLCFFHSKIPIILAYKQFHGYSMHCCCSPFGQLLLRIHDALKSASLHIHLTDRQRQLKEKYATSLVAHCSSVSAARHVGLWRLSLEARCRTVSPSEIVGLSVQVPPT